MNGGMATNGIADELARAHDHGGLDSTNNQVLADLLGRLESDWPRLALIVESRIHAGRDAMLIIHDDEDVLLCKGKDMHVLRSWRVDPDIIEALRPLSRVCRGRCMTY